MSEQFALFESPAPQPEGLRYAADFVSLETEQRLISGIRDLPLQPFQFGQFEGKRRVASFGFRYDYALRQLQRSEPIPTWLAEIVAKVETFGGPATPIRQVLFGSRDLVFGGSCYRPDFAGYNDLADVARLKGYLQSIDPIAWQPADLAAWRA